MSFARTFRRAVVAAVAVLVWGESDEAAVVRAQPPDVVCDQDWSGAVSGRVNCFVDPRESPRYRVPPPAGNAANVGNFREGAEYWEYRLRTRGSAPLLYCSASTPVPGPEPSWRAEAVGGGIRIGELDYGREEAPPGSDRLVQTFWGGRADARRWTRRSRYDREEGRWRGEPWAIEGEGEDPGGDEASDAGVGALVGAGASEDRAGGDGRDRDGLAAGSPGASCPEDGVLVNRLVMAGRLLGGCMAGRPAGEHWIHDAGRLREEARYRPRGEEEDGGEEEEDGEDDGGDDGGDDDGEGDEEDEGADPDDTGGGGDDDDDDDEGSGNCEIEDGENGAVSPGLGEGCESGPEDDEEGPDSNTGPRTGDGGTDDSGSGGDGSPSQGGVGDAGDGLDYQDGAGVVAVRHNLACVELNVWEVKERVVVELVDLYDPSCDLGGGRLRDPSCDLRGFDAGGVRQQERTRRELYWERVRGPENHPWARVFWEGLPEAMGGPFGPDGAGGVVMGEDGSGYCLLRQGLVPNPDLPGVVPSVSQFLAGVWAEPFRGSIPAVCPSQEDSFGASVVVDGAGTFGRADALFGVRVSVDHAPVVGRPGLDEDRTQAEYRAMRPCADHPEGAAGCGEAFASSAARGRRLAAAERLIAVGESRGRTRSWSVGKDAEVVAFDWRLADTFNRPHVDGVDRALALRTDHGDAEGAFGSATSSESRVLVGPWFGCGSLPGTVFGESNSLMSWWKGRGWDFREEQLEFVAVLQPLADLAVAAETEAERERAQAVFEAAVAERYREARGDARGICG